jgi:hypothetical protein
MALTPISGPDGTVLFDEPALPNAVDHVSTTQREDLAALDLGALLDEVLSPADPTIATLTPSTVAASAAAVVVTVSGSNYETGAIVEVDQVAQTTTFVDANTLTISYDPTVAGTVQFTVRNPVSEEESNSVSFVVGAGAADDPDDDDDPDDTPTTYDPHGHTVDEVKAYVNDLPNQGHGSRETRRILNLERQGQNRVTLVDWLDAKMGAV